MIRFFMVLCLAVSVLPDVLAESSDANIGMKGALLYPAPCKFPDDPITVNFGKNLHHNAIDGKRYEEKIMTDIDCSAAAKHSLKLRFSGDAASFDSSVINTSHDGLAIEIRQDGYKLDNNQWLNFILKPPALSAIPIKKAGVEIIPGAFTATATFEVDYQ